MAYRMLTGQISHRHPFYGEDYYHTPDMYDFDPSAIDKLYKGVQGCSSCLGQYQERTVAQKLIVAITLAAIGGIGTYYIAKTFGKNKKKSMQFGTLAAGVFGVSSLLTEKKTVVV